MSTHASRGRNCWLYLFFVFLIFTFLIVIWLVILKVLKLRKSKVSQLNFFGREGLLPYRVCGNDAPPLTLNHASSLSINFRPSTRLKENCGICRTNLNTPQNSRSSISKHVLVFEATTNTSWSSKCTWGTYTQFLFMRMPANSSMKSYISKSWEAPWWTTLLIKLLFGVSSGELYYILPLTHLHLSTYIYM